MYFFYYLLNTFGEFEKDSATFQASDVWHNSPGIGPEFNRS